MSVYILQFDIYYGRTGGDIYKNKRMAVAIEISQNGHMVEYRREIPKGRISPFGRKTALGFIINTKHMRPIKIKIGVRIV